MGKFNRIQTPTRLRADATKNFEGGPAYTHVDRRAELLNLCATALVEDKFYEKAEDSLKRIRECVGALGETHPEFVLQLAGYLRTEQYLRSITTLLYTLAANTLNSKPFVRKYTPDVLQRADEVTEALAYQLKAYGKPIPNSLKKGLGDALDQFDEYQYSKYFNRSRTGAGKLSLKTVLRLIHKKPSTPEQEALLGYYVKDEPDVELVRKYLPKTFARDELLKEKEFTPTAQALAKTAHATWETLIATFGSTKETWQTVLPTMGYMARLRNLRNFLKAGIDIQPVLDYLKKPEHVKRSKQLPFRFLSAKKVIEQMNDLDPFTRNNIIQTLDEILQISIQNIPRIPGRSFLCTDVSGSMSGMWISKKGTISPIEIGGLLLGMAAQFCDNAVLGGFGTCFGVYNFPPSNSVFQNYNMVYQSERKLGSSTNGHLIMEYLLKNKLKVDRVFIFTDMEIYQIAGWESNSSFEKLFREYRRTINPNVFLYFFNLANYGHLMLPENDPKTVVINGWSDSVFKFINYFEQDRNTQVDYIQSNRWRKHDGSTVRKDLEPDREGDA